MAAYNTTYNYLITHVVIPQLLFSDLDFFYEKILVSPDVMQQFMQKAMAHASALAQRRPDTEPPYVIDRFQMGIFANDGVEHSKRSVIVIEIPGYNADCDCVAIAFPTMREKAAYFTGELGFNIATNAPCFFFGGWIPDGDSFTHLNYGMIEPSHMGRFTEMALEIAYGANPAAERVTQP